MSRLQITDYDPYHDPSADTAEQLKMLVARQRRTDSIQSLVVALIVIGLIAAILYLIAILPSFKPSDEIVAYAEVPPPEENPVDRPDMAVGAKPTPTSSSSAMARVIAAAVEAPVAVPMPEEANPTTLFGIDDDFNAGFGAGDGDGDGGGGSSFYGTPRPGRRVVYIIDFSESMNSDATGGTRLAAAKKELNRSIEALKQGTIFNVIFFAHRAWTFETEGPDYADNGWNGLNEVPPVGWHPATPQIKSAFNEKINGMTTGRGTVWYSPLKMALSMTPQPDTIYLLSDGEPSDLDDVLIRIDDMNPGGVPIDTIALECPGEEASAMNDLANETGGQFTLIHNGKPYRGMQADKFLTEDFE
ncbi:MAG: hypothetical protein AAGI48_13465 [Verrucomicrobiota bacterium]